MYIPEIPDDLYKSSILFAGPAAIMAVLALIVPLILNPYVLGWPCNPSLCAKRVDSSNRKQVKSHRRRASSNGGGSGRIVDLHTFMKNKDATQELNKEIGRVQDKPDVELGSLATNEFGSKYPMSIGSPYHMEQAPPAPDSRRKRSTHHPRQEGANRGSPRDQSQRSSSSRRAQQPSSGRRPVKSQSASDQAAIKLAMI